MLDTMNTKALHAADLAPWPRRALPVPACAGHPTPDLWFPLTQDEYDTAVGVCARCPLVDLCADIAARRGEYGIWGGVLFTAGKPLPGFPTPGRPRSTSAA